MPAVHSTPYGEVGCLQVSSLGLGTPSLLQDRALHMDLQALLETTPKPIDRLSGY
ncbi:MAG: hypothetical protein QW741_02960 [Sulfolobales archaeon]